VGKQLMQHAGENMKRTTMELGGHAPVIVCGDIEVERVAKQIAAIKLRNAGQNCLAPTRILIERSVFESFCDAFVCAMEEAEIGYGMGPSVSYGPLMHSRRVDFMDHIIRDAVERGATLRTGGKKLGSAGWFYPATVLSETPCHALVMNEEPFGPIATVNPFDTVEDALIEANRLEYGLAAYVYTSSLAQASQISYELESGMVSVNHYGLGIPELPFGGIKDSGHGTEGGAGALMEYMYTKVITERRTP